MTIEPDLENKILRYHYAEKWPVGTIARQLKVHHSTVRRILTNAGVTKEQLSSRPSLLDPFVGFVTETLEKFPTLRASRLYEMVCERGYRGRPDHFRHLMALYRPKRRPEAYLRLKTLPGEQAQVDWGHFGHLVIGRAKRPLMAFVMVLSSSRKIFLQFFLSQQMGNFLRGHEAAFTAWNGVPRVLLFDNLKACVLERKGDAIRFNPTFLEFSAHYRFEARPVAVARGNEKGRVERSIRYIRDNFFAGRSWRDLDDLNEQALRWCEGIAADRLCPEDRTVSVREAFAKEKELLLSLPANPYPSHDRAEVKSGKTPYVRFDWNDYSIPYTHVQRLLTVIATADKVSILEGSEVIAEHARSYDKGAQIEEERHIQELTDRKKQARHHRGQDRLSKAVPCSHDFMMEAAQQGYALSAIVKQLIKLLDLYGAKELELAMNAALLRKVPHPNAVRIELQKQRETLEQLPPVDLDLPKDPRVRELVIRPHALENYSVLENLEEN